MTNTNNTPELLDRVEVTLRNALATYDAEARRFAIPEDDLAVTLKLAIELTLAAQSSVFYEAVSSMDQQHRMLT